MPATLAITIGVKALMAKWPTITSWANNAPAIGALKEAATAAAAPQPNKARDIERVRRSVFANQAPKVAPK